MKRNFKKSLSGLMAVLMLITSFGVIASAATYTATVSGGTNGTIIPEYAEWDGAKITTDNSGYLMVPNFPVYSREGYVQSGWNTAKSGSGTSTRIVSFSGTDEMIKTTKKLTKSREIYPHWTVCSYEVKFVPGDYGVGTETILNVNHDKTAKAPGEIFTRAGYSQIGWSTNPDDTVAELGFNENTPKIYSDVTYYPVWRKDICSIEYSVSPTANFGVACEGYSTTTPAVLTITNTGNKALTYTLPSSVGYNITASATKVAAGSTITITIAPKAGLALGVYNEALVFDSGIAETNITINAAFKVLEHKFAKYTPNGDASYTSDGTKTAYCINGCGETDTIVDEGSMKIYSAKNNTAVGLADEYVHHRTVRFTAYGSGMDDYDYAVGLRFVPTTWYVTDEFQGEFVAQEDGTYAENAFDVVYTHTVFGEYTLVINYVEQELVIDEEAGTAEWVATGVTDTKEFTYTVGTTAEEEQEIVRPNMIVSIIMGLLAKLASLLGITL